MSPDCGHALWRDASFHCESLCPGVAMGISQFNAGGNPVID